MTHRHSLTDTFKLFIIKQRGGIIETLCAAVCDNTFGRIFER